MTVNDFFEARQLAFGSRTVQNYLGFNDLITRPNVRFDVEQAAQVNPAGKPNRNAIEGNAKRVGIEAVGDFLTRAQGSQNVLHWVRSCVLPAEARWLVDLDAELANRDGAVNAISETGLRSEGR